MATRPFEEVAGERPSLLTMVEEIVVESHRRLYLVQRKRWSRPAAYRWLHYEDPMPVERLAEGVEKLKKLGAEFDAGAVDKACMRAVVSGFSN